MKSKTLFKTTNIIKQELWYWHHPSSVQNKDVMDLRICTKVPILVALRKCARIWVFSEHVSQYKNTFHSVL